MNNNETLAVRQPITASANKNLGRDLRRAVKIVNAEYQQIEWEDQAFLNHVLRNALNSLENREVNYGDN